MEGSNMNIKEKITSKKFIGIIFIVFLIIGAILLIVGLQTPLKTSQAIPGWNFTLSTLLKNGHLDIFNAPKSIPYVTNYSALLSVALAGASILIVDSVVLV